MSRVWILGFAKILHLTPTCLAQESTLALYSWVTMMQSAFVISSRLRISLESKLLIKSAQFFANMFLFFKRKLWLVGLIAWNKKNLFNMKTSHVCLFFAEGVQLEHCSSCLLFVKPLNVFKQFWTMLLLWIWCSFEFLIVYQINQVVSKFTCGFVWPWPSNTNEIRRRRK